MLKSLKYPNYFIYDAKTKAYKIHKNEHILNIPDKPRPIIVLPNTSMTIYF